MVAGEGEDHRGDGRRLPLAHVVEVEHALHGPVLQAVDDGPRLGGGRDDGVALPGLYHTMPRTV